VGGVAGGGARGARALRPWGPSLAVPGVDVIVAADGGSGAAVARYG